MGTTARPLVPLLFLVAGGAVVAAGLFAQLRLTGDESPSAEKSTSSTVVAADRQGLPPCQPGPELWMFGSADGRGASVVASVGFTSKDAPCRLEGLLRMEVLNSDGVLVPDIFANPDGGTVDLALQPSTFETSVFAWENWCGEPGPFDLRLTVAQFSFVLHDVRPPDCASPTAGSQLRSVPPAMLLNEQIPRQPTPGPAER